MIFWYLTTNEITKMLRKRRFLVILVILFALMLVFSYGEQQTASALAHQLGSSDWHVRLQQELTNDVNHLHSPILPAGEKAAIQANIQVGQYELNQNINPFAPGAPSFMRTFMDEGITLLVPLFVIVIAADMVSSEMSGGTIKVLLTRGVSRGKVLAGKLVALFILVAMLVGTVAVSAYTISGIFFGYKGFGLPVFIGFRTTATGFVDLLHVHAIALWKSLLMTYGFGYFACLCIACLAFMVSTLVRSTAFSMGIMMAALIAGTLLSVLATNWNVAKYLPMANLHLSGYLNGSPPPVVGMTFSFSILVLTVWSLLSIGIAFLVFTKRDMMG